MRFHNGECCRCEPMVRARRTRGGGLRPDPDEAAAHSEVRVAVVKFLLVGFLALVLVAIPVAFWIRAEAESHGLNNAVVTTQQLADVVAGPLVTDELLAADPSALASLDRSVRPWLQDGSALRVKVWDAGGKVVYSDKRSLIGQRFELPDTWRELLAGGPGTATVANQQEAENEFESASGELVEVYVRAVAANGTPLVFEAYYDDDRLREEQNQVLYGMIPPFLVSLAVLQLAQMPPAVRLARRIQANRTIRHRLLKHAIEASDLERMRIARDLHDEVIQDLSGLSYALEAEEVHGTGEHQVLLSEARAILQRNVGTLRAMISELYPPDLDRLGLTAALAKLAEPLRDRGIALRLDVPAEFDLDRGRAAMLYRVARESLANAAKHSHAANVRLSLRRDLKGAEISISDDGIGFDDAHGSPDGHTGLRILRDTFKETGGTLEIRTAPGSGTTVTARFAHSAAALL